MTVAQAKRERTKLRRTRVTRTTTEPCQRCGGAGGAQAWKYTGWTCYRCGGNCTEQVTRRVYEDAVAQAREDELTEIIEAERQAKAQAKWEAGRAERERAERESDHEDALVENAARDVKARSDWLDAEAGDRVDVEATVVLTMSVESFYGESRLVVFRTDEGNALKTFGTGLSLWGPQRGDLVTVRGTVKDFDTYEGEKQTVLTRVKVTKDAAS
jgi:ssDNA-binding Zn-finger/Zn-ribbon topoisomerase 1